MAAQEPSADMLSPFLHVGLLMLTCTPLSPEQGFLELFPLGGSQVQETMLSSSRLQLGVPWISENYFHEVAF